MTGGFLSLSLFLCTSSHSCGGKARGNVGIGSSSETSRSTLVSHNSTVTFHCSLLEHVKDSWCQIPCIATDGCDAINLAELDRLTRQ